MTIGTTIYSSFDPDTALFAGDGPYRHRNVTLGLGTNPTLAQPASGVANPPGGPASPINGVVNSYPPTVLRRGTLLGRQAYATGPGAATAAATPGNTGNGVLTPDAANPVLANGGNGPYVVKFTSATAYDVFDATGRRLASGAIGGPAYADQIKFAIAAGATAFVAGDTIGVTVGAQDSYVPCVASATDGSQVPVAILAALTDLGAGPLVGPAYFAGAYAFEKLYLDASWTSKAQLEAALRQAGSQLYVKTLGTQEDVL